MVEFSILGKRTPREESVPKVKGEGKYTVDITLPEMLYGKVLTSPHAHAKILNIDTSRAKALPGVMAVITGKDFSGIGLEGTRCSVYPSWFRIRTAPDRGQKCRCSFSPPAVGPSGT